MSRACVPELTAFAASQPVISCLTLAGHGQRAAQVQSTEHEEAYTRHVGARSFGHSCQGGAFPDGGSGPDPRSHSCHIRWRGGLGPCYGPADCVTGAFCGSGDERVASRTEGVPQGGRRVQALKRMHGLQQPRCLMWARGHRVHAASHGGCCCRQLMVLMYDARAGPHTARSLVSFASDVERFVFSAESSEQGSPASPGGDPDSSLGQAADTSNDGGARTIAIEAGGPHEHGRVDDEQQGHLEQAAAALLGPSHNPRHRLPSLSLNLSLEEPGLEAPNCSGQGGT